MSGIALSAAPIAGQPIDLTASIPTTNADIGFGPGVGTPAPVYGLQVTGAQLNGLAGGGASIQIVGSCDPVVIDGVTGNTPTHWDPICYDMLNATTLAVGTTPGGFLGVISGAKGVNWIAAKRIAGAPTATKLFVAVAMPDKVRGD